MRCTACQSDNEDGAAFCANCAAPLTAYAGRSVADADPARTAQRLAELRARPSMVVVLAVMDGVIALVPVMTSLRAVATRPQLTEDSINYIGHAFGGLSAIVTAAVMLLLAAALIVLAWGTMTQRAWAWYANAGLIGLLVLRSLVRLPASPLMARPVLGAMTLLGAAWVQPSVRRWYGLNGTGV